MGETPSCSAFGDTGIVNDDLVSVSLFTTGENF